MTDNFSQNIKFLKTNYPKITITDDASVIQNIYKSVYDFYNTKELKNNINEHYLLLTVYYHLYYIYKYIHFTTKDYLYMFSNIIINDNLSYYELFLTILLLCFIIIMVIIMYWDYVYRSANKQTRCTKILDIIDVNQKNDNPFIYNVYIFNEDDVKDLLYQKVFSSTEKIDKSISDPLNNLLYNIVGNDITNLKEKATICLQYNFNAKKTVLQSHKDVAANTTNSIVFNYLDINDMSSKSINIIDSTYKVIVTSSTDKVLNDDTSLQFAKFVKDYGKDITTNLAPIFNILNAYEQYINDK